MSAPHPPDPKPCSQLRLGESLLAAGVPAGTPGPAPDRSPLASRRGSVKPLAIAIDPTQPGPAVPADFLGLSFEVKSLTQIGALADWGDLAPLLRTLGHGVIRYGGVTADTQVAWSPDPTMRPAWSTTALSPADLINILPPGLQGRSGGSS